jgi:hypothetical protein
VGYPLRPRGHDGGSHESGLIRYQSSLSGPAHACMTAASHALRLVKTSLHHAAIALSQYLMALYLSNGYVIRYYGYS